MASASGEDRIEPESNPSQSTKAVEDKYNVEAAEIRANEALVCFLLAYSQFVFLP